MIDQEPEEAEQATGDEQARQREAAALWQGVRDQVRAAAQAGLPPPALRAELARELASMADWLRMAGQPSARPSAKTQPAAQTVLVRRDQRRRSGPPPLQVRLDRRLWDALDQPTFLRLEAAEGLVRLLPASEANGKRVRVIGTGPFLLCPDAELALGEGAYAAHVAGGALVIGHLLDDGEAG
jgi:hypothetical protein